MSGEDEGGEWLEQVRRARDAWEAGDAAAARELVAREDMLERRDPALHMALGALAEEIGELGRAVREYNLVVRDDPDSVEAWRRLGQLRADHGQLDRAVRCYERLLALAPEDAEATMHLARWQRDRGHPDEAQDVLAAAHGRTADQRLGEALSRARREARNPAAETDPPAAGAPAGAMPTEGDAINFCTLFGGREGVYARQWAAPGGATGYTPVSEPFTPAVAMQHLSGNITVGIYPVRLDRTVNFLAFDLDAAKYARTGAGESGRARARLDALTHAAAVAIAERAAAFDLPSVLEDSGQKGRHVWMLFASPIPALAARRLGRLILDGLTGLPAEITVELFPKQSTVPHGGLGNLIKLPLSIHRRSGRPSRFLRQDGTVVPDPCALLAAAPTVRRDDVLRILERYAPGSGDPRAQPGHSGGGKIHPLPGVSLSGAADGEHDVTAEDVATLPAGLAERAPYDLDQDQEALWLRQRCPVLNEIIRRAETASSLTADERVVLTYTLGHATRGAEMVNAVLARTLSVQESDFLKSRLRGNPMSCPKIRSRVSAISGAVDCNCRFDLSNATYPTPLLHLSELRAERQAGGDAVRLTRFQLENLVGELIKIKSEQRRMQRLQQSLEERLRAFMEEQAITELVTRHGLLRRDETGTFTVTLPGGQERQTDGGAVRDGAGRAGQPEVRAAADLEGGRAAAPGTAGQG
ncbi:MAG: tetratricopeptide repeat protein [Candidatus Schekmanbacteria bacterium]|nr:tetratricopeptide repeat protein [Candidatus Schekmanbacteria bacterium]